jgi:fucose permease
MNFDRYLATYYPLFHRTSVTKGKLLTLLGILITIELALGLMSFNDFVISNYVHVAILLTIVAPPMFFINYKLFRVGRENRRNNEISTAMKKSFSPKNISSCLLCVACYVGLNIPVFVYIALAIASRRTPTLSDHDVKVAELWSRTVVTMSATCNCLIFYWKNKILRIEGMKLIKRIRICRRFRSRSDR